MKDAGCCGSYIPISKLLVGAQLKESPLGKTKIEDSIASLTGVNYFPKMASVPPHPTALKAALLALEWHVTGVKHQIPV